MSLNDFHIIKGLRRGWDGSRERGRGVGGKEICNTLNNKAKFKNILKKKIMYVIFTIES